MIFENIVGNEKNKKLLEDIIIKNKIANAYMFIGQESIGKFLFAKEFAKAILCLNPNKPCNTCKSCLEFDNSNKYNCQNVADIVYKTSNGSINKSIQVIERQSEFETINKIFSNLETINIIDLMNSKDLIFKDKEEINNILDYIITIFFEKIKINNKYIGCINIAEKTKERLRKNSNYDMTIDNFMLNVWEEING